MRQAIIVFSLIVLALTGRSPVRELSPKAEAHRHSANAEKELFSNDILFPHSYHSPQAQEIKKMKVTELETYIGQCDHPLIVNFWATFCVPCVKEIPYFQSTVDKYKDQGVELLLVSLDLPDYYPVRIADFVKKNHYKASFAWLNETDADYFCPKIDKRWSGGIPSSLFVNNKAHYRQFFDRQLTEGQVEPAIKAMLGGVSP